MLSSLCLSLCQNCIILINGALYSVLKLGSVNLPTLFVFITFNLIILDSLYFHTHFKINISFPTESPFEVSTEIVMNL